jgi:hypothetical protein
MTLSSSVGRKFSVAQLSLLAFRRAGLKSINQPSLTTVELSAAKDELELIIDELATEGVFARSVKFQTVDIVSGVAEYTLNEDVLDVIGTPMFMRDGEVIETACQLINRNRYQLLTNKTTESSHPTLVYPHREGEAIVLKLWSVPNVDGTLTIEAHRLLADVDQGDKNPDLRSYWYQYLVTALAAKLAQGASLDGKSKHLLSEAMHLLQKAKGKAHQRGPQQFYMGHG